MFLRKTRYNDSRIRREILQNKSHEGTNKTRKQPLFIEKEKKTRLDGIHVARHVDGLWSGILHAWSRVCAFLEKKQATMYLK
jgi:hypothetical protein